MPSLIAIIGAIFAFFVVVIIHELGHFLVARMVGVKVLRFSIGFGKPIFKHRAKSGVEYAIGFLPLGGYVKMQDAFSESDNLPGSSGIAFEKKSLIARMAVVLAGPIANLILAFFIFMIVFTVGVKQIKPIVGAIAPNSIAAKTALKTSDQIIQMGSWKINDWQRVEMFLIAHVGENKNFPVTVLQKNNHLATYTMNLMHWQFNPLKPDLLSSVGITPYFPAIPPIVFSIMPHSPASKSDLKAEDRIISIAGHSVRSWQEVVAWIEKHPNQLAKMQVRRDNQIKTFLLRTGEKNNVGFLGVYPKPIKLPESLQYDQRYAWYLSPMPALTQTGQWIAFHLIVIKQMLMGRISLKALGGPVSIFQTAGTASLAGLMVYLQFVALISVVLGVLNLMPIPALDGGHFLFFVIEGLLQRPIPVRIQILLINLGVLFLITMMLYATFNDVTRLLQ